MKIKLTYYCLPLALSAFLLGCLTSLHKNNMQPETRNNDLKDLIRRGDLKTFKDIIQQDTSKLGTTFADAENNHQQTLLELAISLGGKRFVKCLVEEFKVDVATKDDEGNTALHIAIACQDLGILKYLIAHLSNQEDSVKEIRNDHGATLLHFAAHMDAIECLKYLVEKCGLAVSKSDKQNGLPLHYAASHGNLTCMLYLIKKLETQGQRDLLKQQGGLNKYTPLHCLVLSKSIEDDDNKQRQVIAELSESKDIKDACGHRPRDLALGRKGIDIDLF